MFIQVLMLELIPKHHIKFIQLYRTVKLNLMRQLSTLIE